MARTNKTTRSPLPQRTPSTAPAPAPKKAAKSAEPKGVATSAIRFDVHPGMQELQDFARQQGWLDKGWTHMSFPWQELVYTADNWKTTNALKSSEVPSPFVDGRIVLSGVPAGTEVEFAIHVGVASHAPSDVDGYRERGDVWLNNSGRNYRQVTA